MADQASQGLLSPILQRARMAAALPYISGDVLDIGCGNGALAAHVMRERYYGYDRAAASVAIAARRFPAHAFSNRLPPLGTFDTIVALAVIEHLEAPADTLRDWARYLREGGRIVLTTPHVTFRRTHEIGSMLGLFSHDAAEEHETMFDRAALARLAGHAGLKLALYRRFLFGANQLCVMALNPSRNKASVSDSPAAEPIS